MGLLECGPAFSLLSIFLLSSVLAIIFSLDSQASQVGLVVKNPRASAGDVRGTGSVPGLGRVPGEW